MDDVQLADYLAGAHPGPVEAWRADQDIARILNVQLGTVVWLSDYTLTKTQLKHAEVDFSDYKKIPEILTFGFVVPGTKNRTINVCYIDTSNKENFRLWRTCLKATQNHEVFITLIHRLSMKEARRYYRRAQRMQNLLRDHKDELARQMLAAPVAREGGAP